MNPLDRYRLLAIQVLNPGIKNDNTRQRENKLEQIPNLHKSDRRKSTSKHRPKNSGKINPGINRTGNETSTDGWVKVASSEQTKFFDDGDLIYNRCQKVFFLYDKIPLQCTGKREHKGAHHYHARVKDLDTLIDVIDEKSIF